MLNGFQNHYLLPDSCVAIQLKMLTYVHVRSAFSLNRRLALEQNLKLLKAVSHFNTRLQNGNSLFI